MYAAGDEVAPIPEGMQQQDLESIGRQDEEDDEAALM